jgi:ABC-type nickel/cobalt efflux system permease component RcnA
VRRPTADLIAVILAAGLSLSIVALVVGVVWAAIKNGSTASTLSENESQVLTVAFSGMIGVLGAWVGYRAGNGAKHEPERPWPELQPGPERTVPKWPDKPT